MNNIGLPWQWAFSSWKHLKLHLSISIVLNLFEIYIYLFKMRIRKVFKYLKMTKNKIGRLTQKIIQKIAGGFLFWSHLLFLGSASDAASGLVWLPSIFFIWDYQLRRALRTEEKRNSSWEVWKSHSHAFLECCLEDYQCIPFQSSAPFWSPWKWIQGLLGTLLVREEPLASSWILSFACFSSSAQVVVRDDGSIG